MSERCILLAEAFLTLGTRKTLTLTGVMDKPGRMKPDKLLLNPKWPGLIRITRLTVGDAIIALPQEGEAYGSALGVKLSMPELWKGQRVVWDIEQSEKVELPFERGDRWLFLCGLGGEIR
jgi:hypothetical protein